MFFFCTKVIIFQNSVFGEIQLSQKSLIKRKNQPHTLPQQVLVQQTLIILLLLLQAPAQRPLQEKKFNSEEWDERRQGLT